MEAAIPVVLFSGLLEGQMESGSSLENTFAQLNHSACRLMKGYTNVCFQMAHFAPQARILHLANGGCPLPYHYRASRNDVVEPALDS